MADEAALSPSEVLLETEKVYVFVDDHGMHSEVAPSKLAPEYLQELLDGDDDNDESELQIPSASCGTSSFDSSCSRSYHELEEWKKRVIEEQRLSRMYQLQRSFSLRFDNRAWLHPHGTTNFDYKAISDEKKENFEKLKNRVRHENYDYLGNHPEIQAIISLVVKKMLHVVPDDPVRFITDFFTTRLGNQKEFEESVESEVNRISTYHVKKMRAAGLINLRPCTTVRSELSGESWRPEQDANYLKKLNIGALAQDFSFDASSLKPNKKKPEGDKLKLKKKFNKNKSKPGGRQYCGCKDWKVGPQNRETTTAESDQEEMQTTTFSTLGHINDNLLTSSAAEEQEEMLLGDGAFYGDMAERESEHDRDLTTAEATMVASMLIGELLTGDNGTQA